MAKRKKRSVRNLISRVSKLRAYAFGHAFGLVSVIGLFFYGVMSWFSSYTGDVIIEQFPLSFSFNNWTLIIGLIEAYVLSYIFGWIFVQIYNRTSS